jgi:hypothetical protein
MASKFFEEEASVDSSGDETDASSLCLSESEESDSEESEIEAPAAAAAAPPITKKRARASSIVDDRPIKKARTVNDDALLVPPLPIVRFIESHVIRKACGKCEECKKPPCGVCKACLQNQKGKSKERKRCESLKCKNDPITPASTDPSKTREEVAKRLQQISSELAVVSAFRGTPRFNAVEYNNKMEEMQKLHKDMSTHKSRKARRRTGFPKGFLDCLGVLMVMETKRQKFARSIVRTFNSDESGTLKAKRRMRDKLDAYIRDWCRDLAKTLIPKGEDEGYAKAYKQKREGQIKK